MARSLAIALVPILALAVSACSDESPREAGEAATAPGEDAITGEVAIEFWHSMRGRDATALNDLVNAFNKMRSEITVRPVFQGGYPETMTEYRRSAHRNETPALVQVYDIGSRFMYDSGQVVPVSRFIEKDGFDQDENVEPAAAAHYTIDGRLWAMPFTTWAPLMYINADAFERAGLDPERPPRTLDDITAIAGRLTDRKKGRAALTAALNGWFVEQWTALDNAEYCDRGNGREGLPTRVTYGEGTGPRIAQWWADLVRRGHAVNTGRAAGPSRDTFLTGDYAIHLGSSAALADYTAGAKDNFTLRTAPFPRPTDQSAGGPVIGGTALWINEIGHSDAEKRAAWEFVKFAVEPGRQAAFHDTTGSVPVNPRATVGGDPNLTVAREQLRSREPSPVTAGCLLGVMRYARTEAEVGLGQAVPAMAGGTARLPAARAMREAADRLLKPIEDYNNAILD